MLDRSVAAVAERQCVDRHQTEEGRAGRNRSFCGEMTPRAAPPQSAEKPSVGSESS